MKKKNRKYEIHKDREISPFFFNRYDEGNQFGPGPNGMLVSLGERVVTMEGTVDAICEAEKVISQKLRDYMEKDLKNSANNPNMVLILPC